MTRPIERDCTSLAVLLAFGQLVLVVLGGHHHVASALPALLAVGLALVPLLPVAVRERPLAVYALVLPLGALALDIAVISVAAIGIGLYPGVILALVLLFAAGGTYAATRIDAAAPVGGGREDWLAGAALVVALVVAAVLAERATGGAPPAGSDWGKYLLYGDQVRAQHSLLIDNPYWLLGTPFREDPGAPALYGALLLLSGGSAAPLAHGIVAMLLLGLLSMFACAVVLFGARAAAVAALVFAVLPANPDMAAWHGLANFWGLAVVPILYLGGALLLRGDDSRAALLLTAAGLVGVAAAHRLTMLIAVLPVAAFALGALAVRPRQALRVLLRLGVVTALIGVLVAWHLHRMSADFGGLQSYKAYLDTKVNWVIVTRDLTWPLIGLSFAALVGIGVSLSRRFDPAVLIGPAFALAAVAYGYAWVVHFPGYYIRATYFLPLAMGLGIAAGVTVLGSDRRLLALLAVAVTGTIAGSLSTGVTVIDQINAFYGWTDKPALKGWDLLARVRRPGEVVVTDRCTGFMSTWLLQSPVLTALLPSDVGPAAELRRVGQARAILSGAPGWQAIARSVNARYATLNPTCPESDTLVPPKATPLYLSRSLVVLRLADAAAPAASPAAAVTAPRAAVRPRGSRAAHRRSGTRSARRSRRR